MMMKRKCSVAASLVALAVSCAQAASVPVPEGVTLVDLTTPTSGSVVADSRPYGGYPAKNAFDGNTSGTATRWLAYKPTNTESTFITYKFNAATLVNAYRIWGGSGPRDFKDWTFEGSDDGTTWTVLDTQTGESNWNKNNSSVRLYRFKNKKAYLYYKFNCTANNGDNLTQTYEMEFYCISSLALGDCSATHEPGGAFTVRATLAKDAATIVTATATNDGESGPFATATIGTDVAEGSTVSGTLAGLPVDKTYILAVTAENDEEATSTTLGAYYSGVLTVEKVQNAEEATTQPAVIRITRAVADPYTLTVAYTVASEGAQAGVNYIEPAGTVTIAAGETSADIEIVPIYNPEFAGDATLTVTLATAAHTYAPADQVVTATLVKSPYDIRTRYVDATVVGGGQRAGTDWEDAYASVKAAVDAVNAAGIPATIYVKTGRYESAAQLKLNGAVKIVGWTGNPADVTIHNTTAYQSEAGSADNRVLYLDDSEAGVYNVTLSGAGCSKHGASAYIGTNGGTVSNCVLGATANNYYHSVSAVYLGGENALVTHSVVQNVRKTNNDVFWSGAQYGLGVHVQKGRLENCLVRDVKGTSLTGANQSGNYEYSATNSVGGVYLAGTGAIARNCTIVDCQATKAGGIYAESGSVAENCVVAECYHYKRYANVGNKEIDPFTGSASALVNCVSDADHTTDELFVDYANGDLAPKVGGPLHNAVSDYPSTWPTVYVDLAGLPRKVGKKLDIGAFEQQKVAGLVIIIK